MKILFLHLFESVTSKTLIPEIKALGYHVVEKTLYTPKDLYEDDMLIGMVEKSIEDNRPLGVMTVNFWPIVALVCHKKGIPYVAWSYDSPQNLPSDRYMGFDTNYIFIFDKEECKSYQKRGIDRVFHMALATDTARWDRIKKEPNASYDITLVGSVYESTFPSLKKGLGEYEEGYIKAIMEAQKKVFGYYMIDELLTDEIMEAINKDFRKIDKNSNVTKGQMSFSIGSFITYQDRLTLLRLLQNAGKVELFSDELKPHTKDILRGVSLHPRISYEKEMPQVFKSSKINLNPVLRVIKSGIPQRALDIMGCNAFMLSSYQPELMDYFVDGESVVCFYSYEDALAKADFYLKNDNEREHIANAGYEIVKKEFTYKKRIKKMFAVAGLV